MIATNTIGQGDTRSTGLRYICENGGTIYNAQKRVKWVGLAAVIVSVIHVIKQERQKDRQGINSLSKNENPLKRIKDNIDENSSRFEPTSAIRPEIDFRAGVDANQTNSKNGKYLQPILDGKEVDFISAFLFKSGGNKNPEVLLANAGKSFIGSYVLGMGFTFDDSNPDATPIAEMQRLIKENPKNQERIFPYIGGEEVNSSPTHTHHRYVINFGEMSEAEAREYPDLIKIVEEKVKPARLKQNREIRARYWWRFGETTPALFKAIAPLERVLVCSLHSQYLSFTFLPANSVFSHALGVFADQRNSFFCLMQSRIHEIWTRFFGSSLEDRLRYTPSDCFETFPFPENWETNPILETIGNSYYEYRAALMVRNNEGLTDTYNRFHDPDVQDPEILKLRELHTAMDRAVLDAYGWSDISTDCDFILDYEEEDEDQQTEGNKRQKKKPWRYRWCEETHDEVLARLLDLNQQRAEAEILGGKVADKSKGKGNTKNAGKKGGTQKKEADASIPGLKAT